MSETGVANAYRLLAVGLAALDEATGPTATDDELVSALTVCEAVARKLDRRVVGVVADLDRRGTLTDRGYRNTTTALADLLGWDRADARRRVIAAEQAHPRTGLDGTPLPAHLPHTAEAFAACGISLRHVDIIAHLLAGPCARRLAPDVWAGAEAVLAAKSTDYTPTELLDWGTRLVDTLDQDGPEPDERPDPVNELHLARHRGRPGGTLRGHYDDAAMFDAIAAAVDAHSRPVDADERRTPAQRQAEALADVCGYVLDHARPAAVWWGASAYERADRAGGSGEPGEGGLSGFRGHALLGEAFGCCAAMRPSSRSSWTDAANRWTWDG